MEAKVGHCVGWKESRDVYSKVNLIGHNFPPAAAAAAASTDGAALFHVPWCVDSPINRRSSPDGSAGETDLGHLHTGGKPINEHAFLATAVQLHDNNKTDDSGLNSDQDERAHVATPLGAVSQTKTNQAYRIQNEDRYNSLEMEPFARIMPGETGSPVSSESRGELLQCESSTFALEDILRHYWMPSERNDEVIEVKQRQSIRTAEDPVYGSLDWASRLSSAASAYRTQMKTPNVLNDAAVELLMQMDRDDVDSIITLSTISEEDSEDLSSVAGSQQRYLRNGVEHDCFFNSKNPSVDDMDDCITDAGEGEEKVGDFDDDDDDDDDDINILDENESRDENRILQISQNDPKKKKVPTATLR